MKSISQLLLVLMAVVIVGCSSPPDADRLTIQPTGADTPDLLLNHTKVKEGMTLPEVITLLGQPTSLEGKVLCYFGRYHSRRGMAVRVHIENEKVSKVVTGTWWDHPEPHMERE